MGALSKLPNIGAQAAWLTLQQNAPSACIHRLLALAGAIRGVKKAALPAAVKAASRDFYGAHKLHEK